MAADDGKEQFACVVLDVLGDRELSDSSKSVFGYLATRQRGTDPRVQILHSEIMEFLGMSKNTVTAAIRGLIERKHIEQKVIATNNGNRFVRQYTLLYRRFGWTGPTREERMKVKSLMGSEGEKVMKCLTLYQPHATLVAIGAKRIETRPMATNHRGLLAIHAGLSKNWLPMAEDEPFRSILAAAGYDSPFKLPLGKVVAVCDLAGCFKMDQRVCEKNGKLWYGGVLVSMTDQERAFGDYQPDRYGYLLEGVNKLSKPVPASGKQGFWNWEYPADLEERMEV